MSCFLLSLSLVLAELMESQDYCFSQLRFKANMKESGYLYFVNWIGIQIKVARLKTRLKERNVMRKYLITLGSEKTNMVETIASLYLFKSTSKDLNSPAERWNGE